MSETAFIAGSPSAQPFIDRVRDAQDRVLAAHRTAGVADPRHLCVSPREPGEGLEE
ncbi:MAG: hypothetical protein LW830_09685 [Phenylobacterium sp.]|nr:hypothetical protein [Phenylobacterium sp.]